MLEAAIVDLVFTISLKRSTLNRQLSTSCPADYPIFWRIADVRDRLVVVGANDDTGLLRTALSPIEPVS
jgi:hypothetical protein